ncbi:MAG: NAD(P)/FAD-dependent oxidoreductase [Bacteroidetes bacterium]|nr:NAD(P)/FAD-dependent oxidoreductase [Bacteroidota bacterium]
MGKINIKPSYDIVVIGAGMGGLTAAAMLSKAGYSVVVVDAANQAGGYLAGFHRNRFRFDTAVHWLNQCNPGGVIHTVFETIGSDYPRAATQNRIKRYLGDHHNYLLTNSPDELKQQLQKEFPHEKKGIERFFKDAKALGERMNTWGNNVRASETFRFAEKLQYAAKTFRFILPFIKHIRFTGEEGLKRGLRRYFKDEKILKIFSTEPDLLSCLVPIGWAYFKDYQNPPKGGGQAFPEWLEHVVKFYKNDTFYHSKVTKILLDGTTATGVEIDHRGTKYEVKSRYVLAACDVETLYEKMLPENVVPKKLKDNLHHAVMYSSSFTISVALDCNPADLGFGEEAIHISKQNISFKEQTAANPETTELIILAPSFRDESLAPTGQGTLTIFMPAEMEQYDFWKTQRDENGAYIRGEEYHQNKTAIAEVLIKRVEEKIAPGLRSHILFYEVATPVTHHRYTGNRNGTMMGARPGKENMKAGVAHYRTPIKNLLLSGHWAELGGGIPIAVKAGFNAALLVFKDEQPEIFDAYVQYINHKISAVQIRESPHLKPYTNSWVQDLTPAQLLAARRNNDNTTSKHKEHVSDK